MRIVPHFYINLPKAKVYPGKKIISGPGNLVLEGIPLPLALPFGFFPIQTKKAASGILIPKVGQEQLRGYTLTDGGYYFAISDYFDLALKGKHLYKWNLDGLQPRQIITNNINTAVSFLSAMQIIFQATRDCLITVKQPITRSAGPIPRIPRHDPGSRFSASVNMSSSGYDKTNSYQVADHVTTQRQSSVSYSKTWEGTPFNLSTSMNHSQNVKN